jgi:hypothetical protein
MSSPVLLIFGAGGNTGLSVVQKFRQGGYKTATVSRNPSDALKAASDTSYPADLSDLSTVERIFREVEADLGQPSVVIYNAYAMHLSSPDDPFACSASDFAADTAVNITSAYAAMKAFATLPKSEHNKVFIFTGNMQFSMLVPDVASLGAGKNAVAYLIETAANVYGVKGKGEKGFWYVGDERLEDGYSVMAKIDGHAHGEFYWELAQKREQGPWYATFVRGKGYVDFETKRDRPLETSTPLMERANKARP